MVNEINQTITDVLNDFEFPYKCLPSC